MAQFIEMISSHRAAIRSREDGGRERANVCVRIQTTNAPMWESASYPETKNVYTDAKGVSVE
jgi:hypothetical protein